MLKKLLGLVFNINTNAKRTNEPSYQIQEFAIRVYEAFKESQKAIKKDKEKKELFITNFDKILKSIDLKTNENLKDEIYQDLTSETHEHLSRIREQKIKNESGHVNKISGVKVKTARAFQNNEIDSIKIRLLIHNLRFRSDLYSSMKNNTEDSETFSSDFWREITSPIKIYDVSQSDISDSDISDSDNTEIVKPRSTSSNYTKLSAIDKLNEIFDKINPLHNPSTEKIKKVLEEYKKYKEQEDLQKKQECKTALKQAIDDALKTDILIPPTIDLAKSISAKNDLKEKINLALNSQSANPPNPGSVGIEINLVPWYQPSESKSISPDALESILFHNRLMEENIVEIITPNRKLNSIEEFNKFLAENGGTNLDERLVNQAFEAYETYYKEVLSQKTSELLKGLKEKATTKVSDHEFDKIVGFLDKIPEAELNASLFRPRIPILDTSNQISIDKSEPPPESILEADIKRDKVAEFEKFFKGDNLNCTSDNIQKVFALHELYEAYEAFGKIKDREDAKISSETKKRLRDQIEKILLPNATEQSVQQRNDITKKEMPNDMFREVPKSSIEIEKEGKDSEIEPHGKINDDKIDKILKYLSKHNKQKKQDNEATYQLNSVQKSDLVNLRKKNVLQFLELKFPSFTEPKKEKIIAFYEKYASEPEEDKKLKFKVEVIMAIADGINVQDNIDALDTLKMLDALDKNNIDEIKKAEEKAEQEKPNEIIKFFEDLPSNILRVFDCFRTDGSSREKKDPTNARK